MDYLALLVDLPIRCAILATSSLQRWSQRSLCSGSTTSGSLHAYQRWCAGRELAFSEICLLHLQNDPGLKPTRWQVVPPLDAAAFAAFQHNYLLVYCLMVAGDWLQGPYMYALYEHYGYRSASQYL